MALSAWQKKLLEIVREERKSYVADLAKALGVTEASIRLDLSALENLDIVRGFHGGARALKPSAHETRIGLNQEAKRRIARKALELVAPNDTLFLDSGTTALMLA